MQPAFDSLAFGDPSMQFRLAAAARAALCLSALCVGLAGHAQEAYPNKPITMIVPFPPGGVADLTGRPTAVAMEKALRQKIVVENKAGAGGGIGMAQVAKSKPDGYTIMMALSSVSVIPEADKILGRAPMYTARPTRADRADLRGPDDPRRACREPVEERQGAGRRCEEASRRDLV